MTLFYPKKVLPVLSSQKYSLVISFVNFICLCFTFRFIFHHRLVLVDCVMCHKYGLELNVYCFSLFADSHFFFFLFRFTFLSVFFKPRENFMIVIYSNLIYYTFGKAEYFNTSLVQKCVNLETIFEDEIIIL